MHEFVCGYLSRNSFVVHEAMQSARKCKPIVPIEVGSYSVRGQSRFHFHLCKALHDYIGNSLKKLHLPEDQLAQAPVSKTFDFKHKPRDGRYIS
jgi:hypothetical protein